MNLDERSEAVSYGPIIQKAFDILARSPLMHDRLVAELKATPTNVNSARKVIRWLEMAGQISRKDCHSEWRLSDRADSLASSAEWGPPASQASPSRTSAASPSSSASGRP